MFDLFDGLPVHPLVVHAVVVLLPLTVLGTWASWRTGSGSRKTRPSRLVTAVAVLAALAGVATTIQVYRVGDSGAKAVWGDQVDNTAQQGDDD